MKSNVAPTRRRPRHCCATGSNTRQRCSVALAALVVFAAVAHLLSLYELGPLQQLQQLHLLDPPAPLQTACVPMPAWHLDPLFAKRAECVSQPQVVAILRRLVFTAVKIFETHNITYFLDSGTLLGAFRDQRVIAHDTDADMAIDVAGFDFIRENRVDVPTDFFLAVYASGDLYPGSQRDKEIPVRLIHRATSLYLDVFVFASRDPHAETREEMVGPQPSWSYDKCVSCPEYYNQGKQLLVPYSWIYPTIQCEFEGKWLQCPRQTELYLRHMYGDDFRTPIQY